MMAKRLILAALLVCAFAAVAADDQAALTIRGNSLVSWKGPVSFYLGDWNATPQFITVHTDGTITWQGFKDTDEATRVFLTKLREMSGQKCAPVKSTNP